MASAIRVLRIVLVVIAMCGGIFGIMAATALLVWHLCSIESYGICYLSPLVDGDRGSWLWSMTEKPLWKDKYRDPAVAGQDLRKQK